MRVSDFETSGACEAGGVYGIRSVDVFSEADRSSVKKPSLKDSSGQQRGQSGCWAN